MPIDKLAPLLTENLAALDTAGRLKGAETVTAGVLGPSGGKGPRFLIEGHARSRFYA